MKIIISPTKSFDFVACDKSFGATEPVFMKEAQCLNGELSKIKNLAKFYKCSDKIGEEVSEYISSFDTNERNQALFSYSGAVFKNMDPLSLSNDALNYLKSNLIILSGMYGVLKPTDMIGKYRLEMQQKFSQGEVSHISGGLYGYWKERITDCIVSSLDDNELLINLASNEYYKVLDTKRLPNIVSIEFKENKSGIYKTVGTYSKMARGKILKFMAENHVNTIEEVKKFNEDGYVYNIDLSSDREMVFLR